MVQANTFDTTLAGNKARVAIENMQERFLDGWSRLGKLLNSRAESAHADRAPDAQPLSGYYAGASDRVCTGAPVTSFRHLLDTYRV
jgi:L-ribulose-5-phosphate 3-epimerase UlaE